MKQQIIEMLAPIIGFVLPQILKPLLLGAIQRNPEHGPVILASLYPGIDAELEPLAADTETPFDDVAVKAIKKVFEDVAQETGVPLSNVDDD